MINRESIKKLILPPGPILSFILIGLLLLGAILYYRSVKIQRFLEPALAISQPKIKFNQNINNFLTAEFGKEARGIKFRAGSVLVDPSVFFDHTRDKGVDPAVLNKFARVFLSALRDADTKEHISLIMVGIRFPLTGDPLIDRAVSLRTQERAWALLNYIYAAEPQLEKVYYTAFVAAAIPVKGNLKENNWIEFRLVPTERLHIEVLQRFEKYTR